MLNKVNIKQLLADYSAFKRQAFNSYRNNDIPVALKYIEASAKIAYNFNFRYADDELEELLVRISKGLFLKSANPSLRNKYVFYDYFGLDNKGLTQQYIRALMQLDVELLYIMEVGSNEGQGTMIIHELQAYPKATILIVKEQDIVEKIKMIRAEVTAFTPSVAFLHFAPWDVVGIVVWNSFKEVKRFFINLTDHAFWLGKSCSDYFLEFRNYGYNISVQFRGIQPDKLLYQPYYPIRSIKPFRGFDFEHSGKVIGFSGASYYKIGGRANGFLKLIKQVIDKNPNFIFLFAGSGNEKPIQNFISEHHLEEKILLLGHRDDLDDLLKHIDIFINTYPISGGLMTQLAVLNKIPVITYTTPDLSINFIEDMLRVDRNKVVSMKTESNFLEEMNRLINDPGHRKKNIEGYENAIPNVIEFNETLEANIAGNNSNFIYKTMDVDYDAVVSLYIETENEFLKNYDLLKLEALKLTYFKKSSLKFMISVSRLIVNHPEILLGYFKKIIRK